MKKMTLLKRLISNRVSPREPHRNRRSVGGAVRSVSLVAAFGLSCLALGCSKSEYSIAPVSGTVTVEGKPVANVMVQFQPAGQQGVNPGPGSVGVTDAEGRYRLKLIDLDRDLDGAVVGRHRVSFQTIAPATDSERIVPVPSVLPPGQENKEVEFDVPPAGTAEANFTFP
jgi:hypothetical protein